MTWQVSHSCRLIIRQNDQAVTRRTAPSTMSPRRPRRKAEVEAKAELNLSLNLDLSPMSAPDRGVNDAQLDRELLTDGEPDRDRGDHNGRHDQTALHHVAARAKDEVLHICLLSGK